MVRKLSVLHIASGLFLTTLGGVLISTNPVQAAVAYCNGAGLPQGCVARPTAGAPVTRAAVTPGVGTPGLGAPGAGLRAGTPMNRGGPVNRVGRR